MGMLMPLLMPYWTQPMPISPFSRLQVPTLNLPCQAGAPRTQDGSAGGGKQTVSSQATDILPLGSVLPAAARLCPCLWSQDC